MAPTRLGQPSAAAPRAAVALLNLVALPPVASAWLCALTHKDSVKVLPKGWRDRLGRLHSLAGCDREPPAPPRPLDETFLQGLEHPGQYWRVDIRKEEGQKLGFNVAPKRDYLEVDRVQLAGAVPHWNAKRPSLAIAQGDCVVSVNGREANGTVMAEELRTAPAVSMRIFRASEEDRQRRERRRREDAVRKVLRTPAPRGHGPGIAEPTDSKVAVLHANNIDAFIRAQEVSLIMFYANWCGHCRELAPEFTRAASLVADMDLPATVRLAKFDDGDESNSPYGARAPEKFNFTSYPSFMFIRNGKHEGFYGADGAREIAAQVAARVKGEDIERAVGEVIFQMRPMMYRPDVGDDVVADLEPETFDDKVLQDYEGNNRVWVIEFYSDKCPICGSLKPEVVKASGNLRKEKGETVKLAAVNSRAFHMLAKRFGVTSYPWIMSIYAGRKLGDMAGLSGAESIENYAKSMHKKHWKKKPQWAKTMPDWPAPDGGDAPGGDGRIADNATGSWREVLGRRTWFFLHTYAAKYPEEPTQADRAAVTHLIAVLGQHYPCPICRKHLREKLLGPNLGAPPTRSRQELVQWFCKLHNMVNKDLNKSQFSCNAFDLDLKYLKSCGECSAQGAGVEDAQTLGPRWDYFQYLKSSGDATSSLIGKVVDEL